MLDRETFRKLLTEGKIQRTKPKAGKANWKSILAKAIKDGGIYTTKQFWIKFVKRKVNKGRTKERLHQACDEDKICARIWNGQTYVWVFDQELVKLYHEKQLVSN